MTPTSNFTFRKSSKPTPDEINSVRPSFVNPDGPCWYPGHLNHVNKKCFQQNPELRRDYTNNNQVTNYASQIRNTLTSRSMTLSEDAILKMASEFALDSPRFVNNTQEDMEIHQRQLQLQVNHEVDELSTEDALQLLNDIEQLHELHSHAAHIDN